MANSTKKLPQHNVEGGTVRVYMDISTEANAGLEKLAAINGRNKKGQLEFMIREAVAEHAAMEAETTKREKQTKKGNK